MFSRYLEYLLSYLKNINQYLTFVIMHRNRSFSCVQFGHEEIPRSQSTEKFHLRMILLCDCQYLSIIIKYIRILQNVFTILLEPERDYREREFLSWKKCSSLSSEPKFVNLFRCPGIDSQPGGQVRQPYLTYRAARIHRLPESIPWNRFLGSLNVCKYGLWAFSKI